MTPEEIRKITVGWTFETDPGPHTAVFCSLPICRRCGLKLEDEIHIFASKAEKRRLLAATASRTERLRKLMIKENK